MLNKGIAYLFLFIYLWIMTILESSCQVSKYKHYLFIISSIILALFIGFRWETGTDWGSYKGLFDSLELNWSFLFNVYHFDIGYVLFNALIKLFTDNYTVFLILNSAVTIFFLSKLINRVAFYPNLSLLLFYTNFMLAQFMGSNRRMMAMVFVLWIFYYIYNKKKKASYVALGTAFLFHRSSIINIVGYFIPRNAFSLKKVFVVLFISCIIGSLQIPAKLVEMMGNILSVFVNNPIVEKMVYYSENGEEQLVSGTGNLIVATILAVIKRSIFLSFYIYVFRKYKVDTLTQFFYNIYVIGFAGYLFFIGSFFQILTAYLAFTEIILIGRIYAYINRKIKILFCLSVFLYGFFQILNALNVYPELYLPYLPFWTNINR